MMRHAMAALALALSAAPAFAEPLVWGVRFDRLERRVKDGSDLLAWSLDASVGSDELEFVWRSEAEYDLKADAFERLRNQARLQVPISAFFDAAAGVMISTPRGPDRAYGVLGVQGLAPQWFEVNAELFASDRPFARFEAEYEGLLTNRLTLEPALELELPLADDESVGFGAWGPRLEIGARLRYDLVDRLFSPHVGLHYERVFGRTADLRAEDGEARDALFFVIGARLMF
ncbi:copper resistance protein B [Oceanicella actignis]|uniref:Copper resistance protein B n=1 Tax=Oceanicella actignis TaxID=1189325 RepID=A0A1M7S3D5_9RHOB|nr:copper resistance protein B [Oceanicella actignis]TYO90209.1 copper resistance protein B [Oceanicella actignis]SES89158.1 copper resistance protein B [Oceanicella actignis]SHN52966.1 copper resistance protein B [Oceanicella actignis]